MIERRKSLIKLLETKHFSSQADVVRAMQRKGFDVTQPSVSRDFRELGVVKLGGRYLPPSALQHEQGEAPLNKMLESYLIAAQSAGDNMVVVHTSTGAASAVAEEVDQMNLQGIVGTVAGDNTFFIAVESKRARNKILKELMKYI